MNDYFPAIPLPSLACCKGAVSTVSRRKAAWTALHHSKLQQSLFPSWHYGNPPSTIVCGQRGYHHLGIRFPASNSIKEKGFLCLAICKGLYAYFDIMLLKSMKLTQWKIPLLGLTVQCWKVQKKTEYADIFTRKRRKYSRKTEKIKLPPNLCIGASIFLKATERWCIDRGGTTGISKTCSNDKLNSAIENTSLLFLYSIRLRNCNHRSL